MNGARIILIGGANGSGKTTLARELAAAENFFYLGADDIAYQLNKERPEAAAIEAARHFSRRLGDALDRCESLIIESTLSGLSLRKQIIKARDSGYYVEVVFIYLDSIELCIRRVAARVAGGGHHVPPEDIRRRYERANKNFPHIYKELADQWHLFFNAADSFRQIAAADREGVIIYDEREYKERLKSGQLRKQAGAVGEQTLRRAAELECLGNRAVRATQVENRRRGIPNWYSVGGRLVSNGEPEGK